MAAMTTGWRRAAEPELGLPPGFRFHPTDEELVLHYLRRKIACQCLPVSIIAEVNLYKYDPWQLPDKALFGEREWYFFTPRDRKYPNGTRPNRAAGKGYWKATGADKPITPEGHRKALAIKKALVFYSGKAPRGTKTNWIMHEYRLADADRSPSKGNLRLDDWVLCRVYNKKNSWGTMRQENEGKTCEDTESSSSRAPESDEDNEVVLQASDGSQGLGAGKPAAAHNVQEEEDDDEEWFRDLKLDDLQTSRMGFSSTQSLDAMSENFYSPPFAFL